MAKFIATQTLFVGTAAAHQPGDEVPEANIERNGWADGVAKAGTKTAEKATEEAAAATEVMAANQAPAPK